MTRARGRLIALEGIDGSGKSTLAKSLVARWRRRGRRVVLWREPTDRALGARAASANDDDPRLSSALFTLDRALHRPQLEALLAKSDVVADRTFYSTLAYQGSALEPRARRALEEMQRAVALEPDVVVWLDLPPAKALKRVQRRGGSRSPLERLATLRRVSRAYRSMADRGGWLVLDAEKSPRELVELADRALTEGATRRRRTGS
ncbi:MAG: dTMP kinase [Thermoplasmata archaeon]|nr:dTMP kinase [Thermoplasmata archaeon]